MEYIIDNRTALFDSLQLIKSPKIWFPFSLFDSGGVIRPICCFLFCPTDVPDEAIKSQVYVSGSVQQFFARLLSPI